MTAGSIGTASRAGRAASPCPASAVVSVVIVCFHSASQLEGCLAAMAGDAQPSDPPLEVIVVNNSRDDRPEVAAICARHGATFVQSPQNLGYGRGCNLGAARAKGRYLAFLNPDVRPPRAALDRLVALAEAAPDLVALGPLQDKGGGRLHAKRRVVGQARGFGPATLRRAAGADTLVPTRFLLGGAMVVRRAAFDRIGGFDPQIFLFYEDDDLCLRLSQLGRLAYAAGVVVGHAGGLSTPPTPRLARTRAWHRGYAHIHVARKHFGPRAVLAPVVVAAAACLGPGMLTRRGRIKRRAMFAGMIAALRGSAPPEDVVPT